jgi:two-component system, OmpR family, KDP operon response regulator KdpE
MPDSPASDPPRVLLIEDSTSIARALRASIQARGYKVDIAFNGRDGIELAAAWLPAVIILDLGLPDTDGMEVLAAIRRWSAVPVIVLTADGQEYRKVEALDSGADDYVTKPFSTPELLARIRVALRRQTADADADQPVVTVGDVVVDLAHHRITVAGRKIDLTPKEFAFLAVLARHEGRVLTHRAILREVWGPAYGTETQYLRVYASQLRKKLGEDPAHPRLITEPGVGYRLVDPAAD